MALILAYLSLKATPASSVVNDSLANISLALGSSTSAKADSIALGSLGFASSLGFSTAPDVFLGVSNSIPSILSSRIMPLPISNGANSSSATACLNSSTLRIGCASSATCKPVTFNPNGLKVTAALSTSTKTPLTMVTIFSLISFGNEPADNIKKAVPPPKITTTSTKPLQPIQLTIQLLLFPRWTDKDDKTYCLYDTWQSTSALPKLMLWHGTA